MAVSEGRRSREEWEEIGMAAILDLLGDRRVVPWSEVEARISVRGWKDFETVYPVQLSGARRRLREEGRIVEEESNHSPTPVRMIRLPYPTGEKRAMERLAGSRRKLYRKYLAWCADQRLCGRNGELVFLDSAKSVASEAGLYVPAQAPGQVGQVQGVAIEGGTLDLYAHILDVETVNSDAVLAVEVKNIHQWIYPDAPELWGLLVKAAGLAEHLDVVPVLACVRYAYQAQSMASGPGVFLVRIP